MTRPFRGSTSLLLATCIAFASAANSEDADPAPPPIRGARMPALSSDGKRIAFVYRGDIWIAPAKGGRAEPVTRHVDYDAYPFFSPDGKWLAFGSRRSGNWDIFVVPSAGGAPRQITYHATADIPSGWSPDGKSVLFAAKRDTTDWTLYAVDVQTLKLRKLAEDYATMAGGNWSADGEWIAYGRFGFPWWRPRYQGSAAAQVWLLHPADGQRRALTTNEFQHLWTRFLPSGRQLVTVTVSEATPSTTNVDLTIPKIEDSAKRTPNLWQLDLNGDRRQLTRLVGRGGVRYPSVAAQSGDIAFEFDAKLWLLKGGEGEPVELSFTAPADDKQNLRRKEKLTQGVSEAEPSPDGKHFAFGLRGDIWTVAIDRPKGVAGRGADIARRLTDWAGEDSDFAWSNDGKKLYFTSDREGPMRLCELDVETRLVKPLWKQAEETVAPRLSPDGKQLAFWVTGREGGLHILDLATSAFRKIAHVPGAHSPHNGGRDLAWSPDGHWIAFTRRSENNAWNLWLVPATGGEPANLTRLNAMHSHPAWSPDGRFLFFQSNRDGDGLYVLPLQAEPARTGDFDLKYEKPKETATVQIDWPGLTRRIRKHAGQNPQGEITVTAEGVILMISDGDIWSVSYDGKETKRLTNGGGKAGLRVSSDGKKVFFVHNGELMTMKPDGGGQEKVTFTADWERDVRAERQAAFAQFWRTIDRGFYDGNFHGRSWEALRKQYEPLIESGDTPEEFAGVMQMMIGELECSHAELSPSSGDGGTATPHIGLTFDYGHTGPGLKVATVPPGAPASFEQTAIKAGEYILAINGAEVSLDEHLYKAINDRLDREFEFTVNAEAKREGSRKVRYKVLSQDEWTDLNYKNRMDRLRRRVEDRSGSRIGYVHLAGMGGSNQTQFEREVYEYILGKEAMIIDVRFNGGGNISDTLIDWLERKPHGFYRPRDAGKELAPGRSWTRPIIVLMNEHSFSNAEMFPSAMKARGLAKLVGKAPPGYVIWTTGFKLVDGTNARLPLSGVFRLDGSPLENLGERPDVEVWMTPDEWLAGRDPQLDKAMELLKESLGRQ
jgi:Tol biopolymer transport system component/C-terminal processing protease CtpA/Prc